MDWDQRRCGGSPRIRGLINFVVEELKARAHGLSPN
jgi:hypothetical protein